MPENRRFLLNQQEEKKQSASVRPSQPHFHKVKGHFCLQYHLPVTINNFCSDLWSLLLWEWAHLLPNVCKMWSRTQNGQHTAMAWQLLHLSSIFHSLEMSARLPTGLILDQGVTSRSRHCRNLSTCSKDFSPADTTSVTEKNTIGFKTDVPNPLNIVKSWYLTHLFNHAEPSYQYCWT